MTAGVPAPAVPAGLPQLPPPDPRYIKHWICERYECTDLALPPHTHVFHPWHDGSPTGRHGTDIDRIYIPWPQYARELWTGRRPAPPATPGQLAGQLSLLDLEEATSG